MTSSSKKVTMTLADLKANVDMTPAKVDVTSAFIQAFGKTVGAAKSTLGKVEMDIADTLATAKRSELETTLRALRDVPLVTYDAWKADWIGPLNTGLIAGGYDKPTAASKASGLKPIVLAVSRGWQPAKGETVSSAMVSCRAFLLTCDDAPKGKVAAEASPEAKQRAIVAKATKAARAHAMAMCNGDAAFADKLALAAGAFRPMFELWIDGMTTAMAAAQPAKA